MWAGHAFTSNFYWACMPKKEAVALEQQGEAREFVDGTCFAVADALWNDGSTLFEGRCLPRKGKSLACIVSNPLKA